MISVIMFSVPRRLRLLVGDFPFHVVYSTQRALVWSTSDIQPGTGLHRRRQRHACFFHSDFNKKIYKDEDKDMRAYIFFHSELGWKIKTKTCQPANLFFTEKETIGVSDEFLGLKIQPKKLWSLFWGFACLYIQKRKQSKSVCLEIIFTGGTNKLLG